MLHPQDEQTLCEAAHQALARGDLHQAADHCKTLLLHFPQSARGYALTSSLFQATGNYKKAYDYSAIATGLDDCVSQYHLQQGHMLYQLKEYVQAEQSFARAVALSDEPGEACRWLANSLVAQERFTEAQSWFARARATLDTSIDEAECALQTGNLAEAEHILHQSIAEHPQHAQAYYLLAILALYEHAFERMEHYLVKALRANPKHVHGHFYSALLHLERGEIPNAMEHLLQGLQSDPTSIPVLLLLGSLFVKQGDAIAGEKAFTHVLALTPDHLLAWYRLLELRYTQNRLKDAMIRLHEVVTLSPPAVALRHLRSLFQGDVPPAAPLEFITEFYRDFMELCEPWVVATACTPHLKTFCDMVWESPALQHQRHASVLDLGCGTGVMAELMEPRTAIRVGVDLSPTRLRIARRSKRYDILYEADLVEFALGSETRFDVIISAGALRWIGNLQPFFQAVRGVMHATSVLALVLEKEASTLAYSVHNHGRYTHHFTYVQDVAQSEGLELIRHQEHRAHEGSDHGVVHHFFTFKKMPVH